MEIGGSRGTEDVPAGDASDGKFTPPRRLALSDCAVAGWPYRFAWAASTAAHRDARGAWSVGTRAATPRLGDRRALETYCPAKRCAPPFARDCGQWSRGPAFGRLQRQVVRPIGRAERSGIGKCPHCAQRAGAGRRGRAVRGRGPAHHRHLSTSRSSVLPAPTDGERSNLGLLRNSWCSPDCRGYCHSCGVQSTGATVSSRSLCGLAG